MFDRLFLVSRPRLWVILLAAVVVFEAGGIIDLSSIRNSVQMQNAFAVFTFALTVYEV